MRLTRLARFSFAKHSRYVIAGGGTGGLSIVAHLLRTGVHSKEVLVIDPSPFHYYQPGWTMVGAGQWMIHSTAQKMEETFPKNTTILRDRVKLVKPESNTLITNNGE
jgi:sulfide:quinone oxidoreductase